MTEDDAKLLHAEAIIWANDAEARGIEYRHQKKHREAMREFNLETVMRRYAEALEDEFPSLKKQNSVGC